MVHEPSMLPLDALDNLRKGNARALAGERIYGSGIGPERLQELIGGQAPYATILTCADSRVPPEHIFDAGFGDLFVCRNAGNVLDEVTLGSVEYAAAHTGCPLFVVLGHTGCGAVGAAVAVVKNPDAYESHNVDDIIRRLLPAVLSTKPPDLYRDKIDDPAWVDAAAYKNVKNVCNQTTQRSPLLKTLIKKGIFQVVGAFYDLASGQVEFME
ncbi:carbonic anhydrase [candidate division WOR-3 bacterium]|nr:carbonic anhydrase [candidate division WOR-3 bacterium]